LLGCNTSISDYDDGQPWDEINTREGELNVDSLDDNI